MAYYGIDLGTSNCLVSKVVQNLDDTFDVKCLSDDEGEESFPSVVYFENSNNYKVGDSAIKHLYTEPDATIELIKVRLGKTSKIHVKTKSEHFEKTPQEISSCLLRHFNSIHHENFEETIITVPAFFDQNQKDATMQAGLIAGMHPKSLIEEPTAAIMYHIFYQYKLHGINFMKENKKNVLVFDFGGGTLDLSLIELKNENGEINPRVICTGGDEELGGNNIDFIFTYVILKYLTRNYHDSFIQDVYDAFEDYYIGYINDHKLRFADGVSNEVKNFIFRLKRNLEKIKIRLSTEKNANIVLERTYKPIPFTRDDFEENVLNDYDINIKERIKRALDHVSKKIDPLTDKKVKVDEVLLIGGSSQIPYIKDVILESFEEMGITRDNITMSDDFDKAVAKGAAIQTAIASGVAIPPFMHNKCESVVGRDIELEHAGRSKMFISRGTEYPLKEKKKYSLKIGHALSESVGLRLNELVEVTDGVEKRQICNFDFYLPIYYTDETIEISMDIDEAGLYKIEAVHDSTNETVEFEPNKKFSLSENELKEAASKTRQMTDIS